MSRIPIPNVVKHGDTWIRFYSSFSLKSEDECWLWNGRRDNYGMFSIKLVLFHATRVMWKLHHGTDPGDLDVLHKCNVKACVNPGHLYLGNMSQNIKDAYADGLINQDWENSRRTKLTEAEVRDIYTFATTTNLTSDVIGRMFHVSGSVVRQIKGGFLWKRLGLR